MFERRKNFWSSSAEIAAVAALYFVAAKGSLEFASINPSATPIWPPTGLALAAVMLRSYRTLPGIFIGAFVANATTAGGPIASAVIALGNSLEAFVAALLMSRWAQGIELVSRAFRDCEVRCDSGRCQQSNQRHLWDRRACFCGCRCLEGCPRHLGNLVARRCGWRSDDYARNRSLDAGDAAPAGVGRILSH